VQTYNAAINLTFVSCHSSYPALDNLHTNLGFLKPLCFWVTRMDRQTDVG